MTASETIRQARRAQLLRRFETHGYPLQFIQRLNAGLSLHEALDSYDG